ncbi:hypothetical protein SAMN04488502_10861 [Dendrosporobacter quercicolus]|uniref:Flagellar assembly protein T N-terminal domain-containing protein n=2 Tax=Dendrosporobacter quercicolus TaxID=146817 RepID=A0A1G9WRZ6_9FIRM|nr:hypothetical protein SAMN04488502_10861 [Dendrosporobacter quercicolus]
MVSELKQKFMMLLVIMLLTGLLASTAMAKEVSVQGFGLNREEAINDALRNAVEQTVGTLVSAETLVKNMRMVKDEIYTNSKGYVNGFEILSENRSFDGTTVTIKANVDTTPNSALVSQLQRLNLIKHSLQDPRIAVIIPEFHLTARIPDPAGETAVIRKLTEAGFSRVVDPQQIQAIRYTNVIKSLTRGETSEAIALATSYNVDYLLVGEAFSEYAGNIGNSGMHSCRARVEAKLIKADTGEIVAAQGFHAGGADITEFTAAKKALNNAGELMGDYMIEKLLAYAGSTETGIQLTVFHATSFSKISLLIKELEHIKGVKKAYIRDYNNGTAKIDLDYTGTPLTLANALKQISLPGLAITAVSNSAIHVSIVY